MKASATPVYFTSSEQCPRSSKGLTKGDEPDYSATLLHRTTALPIWPPHVNHFALERLAREARQDYIGRLFRRAQKAITARFAPGRPRAKTARAMTDINQENA